MLESLGLAGDGDEWATIEHVEAAFNVALDPRNAPGWVTVGDVYASLLALLPPGAKQADATWRRFTLAMAAETGVEPRQVTPATRLLAVPLWDLVGWWRTAR